MTCYSQVLIIPTMLSLPKIVLLLAVVAGVFLVSRILRGKSNLTSNGNKESSETAALDLNPCFVCGNYVATDGGSCERDDCPIAKG